jgi:thiol-disulfide isomerase/thioredoxin
MEKKMFKKILLLSLFTGLILGTVSCKNSTENGQNDDPIVGVYVGNIALNFIEKNSKGNDFSLDSCKGKVILLNFSAMWCGPCRAEVGDLMELYNTFKERGFEIVQCIFQDEDGNPADLSDLGRWITEFKLLFTVTNDPDSSSVTSYNFSGVPFNVIIDRDFIIRHRITGFDKTSMSNLIENYL